MNDNLKILVGISIKMLYSEKVLTSIKSMLQKSPSPTETLSKIIATVFRQAVADAQKAGAQLNNQIVMKALTLTVKEVADMIRKNGNVQGKQLEVLSKTLLAVTTKVLTELTALPEGQRPQPGLVQAGASNQSPSGPNGSSSGGKPRGLISQAMGGM